MVTAAVVLVLAIGEIGAAASVADELPTIDRRPYKIEAQITVAPDARIDAEGCAQLLATWKTFVRRFVGAPWELSIVEGDGLFAGKEIEDLDADAFAKIPNGFDKVWVIRINGGPSGYEFTGREYDATVRRLGQVHRESAPFVLDLPRQLLNFALDLFSPVAEIGETSGGGIRLTVRAAALEAASPLGRVVALGSVFEPLRVVPRPKGKTNYLKIPFTYLRVEGLNGGVADCAIVSALADPLTKRVATKTSLVALGVRAADRPTRLRFTLRPKKPAKGQPAAGPNAPPVNVIPAAGYVLTARNVPDGPPVELGTTGRDGRIVLKPGFADRLVVLRLLAGNSEPMVELPLMPGESEDERTIPIDPKPDTIALETQLESLRDSVVDLVAVRARLEARLKARSDLDDWDGVATTLKEFRQLAPRDGYAKTLTKLKEDAARQQAQTKTAILTRTAQAQLADLESLIERYLDDEIFRGYADALEQARAERARSKAVEAKKKAARKRIQSLIPKDTEAHTP
jgi:hypothetical protein